MHNKIEMMQIRIMILKSIKISFCYDYLQNRNKKIYVSIQNKYLMIAALMNDMLALNKVIVHLAAS